MIMIRFTVVVAVLMALFNSEYAHAKGNLPLTNRLHGVRDVEKDDSLKFGLRFPSLWGIRGGSTSAAGQRNEEKPTQKIFHRLFLYRKEEDSQESTKEVQEDRSAGQLQW